MTRKAAVFVFSFLFFLSGIIAVYNQCVQAANHFDLSAEHEAPAIHCPDAFLNSNAQAPSTFQSDSRNFSKALSALHAKIDNAVLAPWLKDHPFSKLFSQQDLYQLDEVYRL